ncbi:hypothetical protein J155_01638 [Xanthomonas citri pv. citri]|nr:hypothetical protein J151_01640 [Xanthomonas citri subsp. citri A306]AJY81618.1 hypothetical protein J159_01636 [Xanthomonas citri pv. citri]AJY86040.1 hypothetical protein J158_01636 [Xanthomonas citri subsp. citri UI6]QYF44310.1 hypothetical protein HZS93_04714 [Xanthomonas citri]AJY90464.1 hypothetical protein J169_01636 [Xanthomonas citri pv. citri]
MRRWGYFWGHAVDGQRRHPHNALTHVAIGRANAAFGLRQRRQAGRYPGIDFDQRMPARLVRHDLRIGADIGCRRRGGRKIDRASAICHLFESSLRLVARGHPRARHDAAHRSDIDAKRSKKQSPLNRSLIDFQAEFRYGQPTMRAAPDRERRRQQVALPGPVHLSMVKGGRVRCRTSVDCDWNQVLTKTAASEDGLGVRWLL